LQPLKEGRIRLGTLEAYLHAGALERLARELNVKTGERTGVVDVMKRREDGVRRHTY